MWLSLKDRLYRAMFTVVPFGLFAAVCFGGEWRGYFALLIVCYIVAMIFYGRNMDGDKVVFGLPLNDDGTVKVPFFGDRQRRKSDASGEDSDLGADKHKSVD
ncbi:hypothetical protein [Pseudonocardia sp. TMWB2A]|uniref:hypothetical protein n=1 Tax=Pseudonocardia sp. TMWB2A TaxID=687430 RepID=UPI00307D543F